MQTLLHQVAPDGRLVSRWTVASTEVRPYDARTPHSPGCDRGLRPSTSTVDLTLMSSAVVSWLLLMAFASSGGLAAGVVWASVKVGAPLRPGEQSPPGWQPAGFVAGCALRSKPAQGRWVPWRTASSGRVACGGGSMARRGPPAGCSILAGRRDNESHWRFCDGRARGVARLRRLLLPRAPRRRGSADSRLATVRASRRLANQPDRRGICRAVSCRD